MPDTVARRWDLGNVPYIRFFLSLDCSIFGTIKHGFIASGPGIESTKDYAHFVFATALVVRGIAAALRLAWKNIDVVSLVIAVTRFALVDALPLGVRKPKAVSSYIFRKDAADLAACAAFAEEDVAFGGSGLNVGGWRCEGGKGGDGSKDEDAELGENHSEDLVMWLVVFCESSCLFDVLNNQLGQRPFFILVACCNLQANGEPRRKTVNGLSDNFLQLNYVHSLSLVRLTPVRNPDYFAIGRHLS